MVSADQRDGRRHRRRPGRARPGGAARTRRAVAEAAVRRRAARRRGHRAGPAAGLEAGARRTCSAALATSSSAGEYAASEAERAAGRSLPITVVPPGVDVERFHPLADDERLDGPPALRAAGRCRAGRLDLAARAAEGLRRRDPGRGARSARAGPTWCSRSPAAVATSSGCAGSRPRRRRRCGSSGACRTTTCPRLYGCADVYTMPCRTRWGGLEQEGFGIVFVEAAACGVPQVAGESGGAAEAVVDGVTGSSCASPTSRARWRPRSRACSTIRRSRASMGDGVPRTGGRRVLLRRARRAPRPIARGAADDRGRSHRARRRRRHRGVRRHGRLAAVFFTTALQWVGAITALSLFAVGVVCFLWAYLHAVQRSRTDEISVIGLYLLAGQSTPPQVKRTMLGAAGRPGRHRDRHHVRPARRSGRQTRVVAGGRIPRADVRHSA